MLLKKTLLCVTAAAALLVTGAAIPAALVQDQEPQAEQDERTPPTAAEIREFFKVTGQDKMGIQAMEQMLDAFKQTPGLPPGFLEEFKQAVKPEDLVNLVIPIYQKHLERSALQGLMAFAKTPAGKEWFKAQPAIMEESIEVGQKWGQETAMKVIQNMQDR